MPPVAASLIVEGDLFSPVGLWMMQSAMFANRSRTWVGFIAGLRELMFALVETSGEPQARLSSAAAGWFVTLTAKVLCRPQSQ